VGNEWYPYRTAILLENSPLALVALLSGRLPWDYKSSAWMSHADQFPAGGFLWLTALSIAAFHRVLPAFRPDLRRPGLGAIAEPLKSIHRKRERG